MRRGAMKNQTEPYSDRPFAEALEDVIRKHTGPLSRVELKPVLDSVTDYSYEQLRRMTAGDTPVTMKAMEGIANVIKKVDPTFTAFYFMEYRFMWVGQELMKNKKLGHYVFDCVRAFQEAEREKDSASRSRGSKDASKEREG